ncbi:hypothetical protein GCM10008090_10040 [Arenicella chitinivorans]|uniref:Uncharacterized protein n=1 Tax=Arenicella chitinivorans TaxID=1329800 RepID=A0A918RKE3_9GAMM|nr:hypothetical protein [Arenicella chitinivorans]GHA02630.1 hypothetical protein GCM10008090_10040 [Arenicella chitinivorans]
MSINKAKYDACYFIGDDLPTEFTGRLDSSIIDVFSQGKNIFLVEIQSLFPEIHDFFEQETTELFLVRNDLGSRPLFHWALESEGFNIYSSVPRTNRKLKQMRSEKSYFNSLPDSIKPFYYIFNGLDLTSEYHLHPFQGGFLLSFSNWYDIDILTQYLGHSADIKFLKEEFVNGDIRVIARGGGDEVLLLDLKNGGPLYCAKWGKFMELKQIINPHTYLTEMFFKSIEMLRNG